MANVMEAAVNLIKNMVTDGKKYPLHVGEVISCWIYLAGLEESKIYVETGLNTTIDDRLRHCLEEDQKLGDVQRVRIKEFMLNEGIPLPPASESKPKSDPGSIPMGVKLTDDEVANGLSIKIATLIVNAATAISQSIRDDVGLMFAQMQAEKMVLSVNVKTMMRERGWLRIPPYYYPPGAPQG